MYKVIRVDHYGHKGFKNFSTKEEAEEWLSSPSVKEDREFGYNFRIEVSNMNRVEIKIDGTSEVQHFIDSINNCEMMDDFSIENTDGRHRSNARSFLGVFYATQEFGGKMYLVNDSNPGVFPAFIEKYLV